MFNMVSRRQLVHILEQKGISKSTIAELTDEQLLQQAVSAISFLWEKHVEERNLYIPQAVSAIIDQLSNRATEADQRAKRCQVDPNADEYTIGYFVGESKGYEQALRLIKEQMEAG